MTPTRPESTTTYTDITYDLTQYARWIPVEDKVCPYCGQFHGVYTHGCQPVAFPIEVLLNSMTDPPTAPAQARDVPMELSAGCEQTGTPHTHEVQWS